MVENSLTQEYRALATRGKPNDVLQTEHRFQAVLAGRASVFGGDLSVLEDHQPRDRTNAVAGRQCLVLIYIDHDDLCRGYLTGQFFEHGCELFTRPAPVRIEIDENGYP